LGWFYWPLGWFCHTDLATLPGPPLRDLGVSGGLGSRWLRCEKGRETQGGLAAAEGGLKGCGGIVGGGGGAHTADVGQLLCGSCTRLWVAVRGAPPEGGRAGQRNVFRSPVILHDAGQIRLELTAEDIQLDCACHSVASIRASPPAFVFAIAATENTAASVFLCHLHLRRPLAPDFSVIFRD